MFYGERIYSQAVKLPRLKNCLMLRKYYICLCLELVFINKALNYIFLPLFTLDQFWICKDL